MKRIWLHYLEWEEVQAGMWSKTDTAESKNILMSAIQFTGNAELFGYWMLKVLDAWPRSCLHNLTDKNQNRHAWIGQAATCLAIKCPQYLTREAWGHLSEQQQNDANAMADFAIAEFETRYEEQNSGVCPQMEFKGLSRRDTGRSPVQIGRPDQSSVVASDMQSHHQERCSVRNAGI